MSDDTNKTAPNIPIKVLEKDGGKITPQLLVIGRGEAEGNVYPAIVVTKENLNEYVKVRGLDTVLDTLNSRERLDAQAALDYVLSDDDWEEGTPDAKGKPKFFYIVDKFVKVIDKFYETLLSGKVRGGVTIESLENEQEDMMKTMLENNLKIPSASPEQAKKLFEESMNLTIKYNNLKAQIEDIRKNRKPRKTKAEKLAEKAAAANAPQKAA